MKGLKLGKLFVLQEHKKVGTTSVSSSMVLNLDLTQLWNMRLEHTSHVVKFKLVFASSDCPLGVLKKNVWWEDWSMLLDSVAFKSRWTCVVTSPWIKQSAFRRESVTPHWWSVSWGSLFFPSRRSDMEWIQITFLLRFFDHINFGSFRVLSFDIGYLRESNGYSELFVISPRS